MSLDCEGGGAPCVECGEFDFLPYTCPHCHGVFCAAHTSYHHVPASSSPTPSLAPLCVPPPPPPLNTSTTTSPSAGKSSSNTTAHIRCVVCQSFPCVLTPCPQCGESYCAAHRFHGHEDAALRERMRVRGERSHGGTAASGDAPSASPAESLQAVCAPFTAAHPLTLAPTGYQSRRMDLLAVILCLKPSALSAASEQAVTGGDEDGATAWSCAAVAVCSLLVATEMSVGQLRDRLESFLASTQDGAVPSTSASSSSSAEQLLKSMRTSLYSVVPTLVTTATHEPATSSPQSSRGRPRLSLVPLSSESIVRHAAIVNAAVVLLAFPADSAHAEAAAAPSVCAILSKFLYPTGSASGPARDDRVRALSTRLYLQHQQLVRQQSASAKKAEEKENTLLSPTTAQSDAEVGSATAASPPPLPGEVVAPASNEAKWTPTTAAVWPFRHPPPLNKFDFFNSKMAPCGVSAVRPAAAPRVVVALYVADAALPCAVKPMCVALGKEWPMARVVDRLREEAVEQQCGPHRAAATALLKTFALYRLGQTAEQAVECLSGGGAPAVPLQSGDVLVLLCPSEPSGGLAALQVELQRLHALTGKEKQALKADQIKRCTVM